MLGADVCHFNPDPAKMAYIMEATQISGYGTGGESSSIASSGSCPINNNSIRFTQIDRKNSTDFVESASSSSVDCSSTASSINFFSFPPEERIKNNYFLPRISAIDDEKAPAETELSNHRSLTIDKCLHDMITTAQELSLVSSVNQSADSNSNTGQSRSSTADNRGEHVQRRDSGPSSSSGATATRPRRSVSSFSAKLPLCTSIDKELESCLKDAEDLIQQFSGMTKEAPSPVTRRGFPRVTPPLTRDYTTSGYVNQVQDFTAQTRQMPSPALQDRQERTSNWASQLPSQPAAPSGSLPGTPTVPPAAGHSLLRPQPSVTASNRAGPSRNDAHIYKKANVKPNARAHLTSAFGRARQSPLVLHRSLHGRPEARFMSQSDLSYRAPMVVSSPFSFRQADSSAASATSGEGASFVSTDSPGFPESFIDQYVFTTNPRKIVDLTADAIDIYRNAAFQMLSQSVADKPLRTRIKEWGSKLDVIKNIKNKFYKHPVPDDTAYSGLFGMPLHVVQSFSFKLLPLPQFVLDIMTIITEHSGSIDGIFRRCGSHKRVTEMREACNKLGVNDRLPPEYNSASQLNDLSDLIKQYFRALPNRLFSESETMIITSSLIRNGQDNHVNNYLNVLQCVLCIMPDEHREALVLFVEFLADIAKNAESNKMTVDNLAICTLPTIFSMNSTPPTNRRRTIAVSQCDAEDYTILKKALCVLIENCMHLRHVSSELLQKLVEFGGRRKKGSNLLPPLLHAGDGISLRTFVSTLVEDMSDKWRNWNVEQTFDDGFQVSSRDVNDTHPIKSYRIQFTVPSASPQTILRCLATEPPEWDTMIASFDYELYNPDINEDIREYNYVEACDDVPKKSFVTRVYESYLNENGFAFFAQRTSNHLRSRVENQVECYHSVYILSVLNQPNVQGTLVNHICRYDLRGKSSSWYERTYRLVAVNQMRRFVQHFNSRHMNDSAV